MIRPGDLVSLSDLLSADRRGAATNDTGPRERAGRRGKADSGFRGGADRPADSGRRGEVRRPDYADRPANLNPSAEWRAGWPTLLASSAARAVLLLLAALLVAATGPALLGWQPTVVQTGSMQPSLRPGDVVIAQPKPAGQLRPGQVVLVDDPDSPGRLRLHRLVRFDPSGRLVLRGDANPAEDSSPVPAAAVHGVGVLRVPGIGLPMFWFRQERYLPLAMLGLLLTGMLVLAVAYRPASSDTDRRPGRRKPLGRRKTLCRPAAAVLLAGLLALQLAHPSPARARFVGSATDTSDSWRTATYFSCQQAILADNPMLYYRLEETKNTKVNDSTNNGASGSYTRNGVSRGQPGTCGYDGGYAVTLDGSSGYLYQNDSTTAPSTFSWEIWFATSTTNGGWLIGMGTSQTGSSSTTDRQLYLTNSGQVGFGILSGGSKRTVFSAAGYNDGKWHLADATFSAGTGLRLYLDGQLVASNTSVTSAQSYTGYLRIGYDNLSGWSSAPASNFFAGSVDEVSAYSIVLAATRIGYHYGAGS